MLELLVRACHKRDLWTREPSFAADSATDRCRRKDRADDDKCKRHKKQHKNQTISAMLTLCFPQVSIDVGMVEQ